jgi:hypothetical protein
MVLTDNETNADLLNDEAIAQEMALRADTRVRGDECARVLASSFDDVVARAGILEGGRCRPRTS